MIAAHNVSCPTHGSVLRFLGTGTTLVGYPRIPGHNHDDNCKTHSYLCREGDGHIVAYRPRNSCPACDWMGREKCFCSPLGVRDAGAGESHTVWMDMVKRMGIK